MLKGAIFDVDGTLLDSMPIWEVAGILYLKKIGVVAEDDLEERLFIMSLAEAAHYIKTNYGLSQSEEEIQAGINEATTAFYLKEAPLKPGVAAFLQALQEHGIPMIAATNTDKGLIDAVMKRLGIRQYFIDILNCSDLGTTKREPFIYEKALEILGTPKEGTWIFEDVLHAVETAHKADFPLVAVADAASLPQREEIKALADIFVEDLRALSVEELMAFE